MKNFRTWIKNSKHYAEKIASSPTCVCIESTSIKFKNMHMTVEISIDFIIASICFLMATFILKEK